jgi:hypothetical protein
MFLLLGDDISEALLYRLFLQGILVYLAHGGDGQFLPDVIMLRHFAGCVG